MSRASQLKGDKGRLATIIALLGVVYYFLMPVTRDATFGLGKLPINVYPFFTTILELWGLAALFAGFQVIGVPDFLRPVFRTIEALFFWVAPGLFIYMISFVALAWNVPSIWANFVFLFDLGEWAIALAFGFYFSRKIMNETGLRAAIERYFPNQKSLKSKALDSELV